MNWASEQVLVTGGASFISSHVIDHLVERGATRIRVVDDLSSGTLENIDDHIKSGKVQFIEGDLLAPEVAEAAVKDVDVLFHLAAIHGGRGYVDLHQAECANNLLIDSQPLKLAHGA